MGLHVFGRCGLVVVVSAAAGIMPMPVIVPVPMNVVVRRAPCREVLRSR